MLSAGGQLRAIGILSGSTVITGLSDVWIEAYHGELVPAHAIFTTRLEVVTCSGL